VPAAPAYSHGGIVPPAKWGGRGAGYPGPVPPGAGAAPARPPGPGAGAVPAPAATQPQPGPPKPTPTGGSPRGNRPSATTGDGEAQGPDSWETWWFYNKDSFLGIKSAVAAANRTHGGYPSDATEPGAGIPSRDLVRKVVVPALHELIETERANDTTTGALMALARIGEPNDLEPQASVIPRMLRGLADPNQEIAETSALALGILRSEAAIAPLTDLLAAAQAGRSLVKSREVPERTRAFAAFALGLAAHEARPARTRQMVARALVDALRDPNANTEVKVAAVLGLSLDRLDVEPVESTTAAWISRQTQIRFLMRVCADPKADRLVRAHATTALARLAADAPLPLRVEAAEVLVAALQPDSKAESEVVLSAVQGLGRLAGCGNDLVDRKARALLLRAIDAPDPQARGFALISLAEIGSRGGEEEPGTAECRAAIANEATRGRSTSRPWATLALGLLERLRADRGGRPVEASRLVLREWFASAHGRNEVGAGAIALGLAREKRAESLLRSALARTNEDTGQGYVALALGMVGSQEAVVALRDVVRASRYRPLLLEQAAGALALIGDKEVSLEIAGLLAEARGLAAQASLAGALGFIGDARSIAPLLGILARKEVPTSARGLAAAAIGGVAEEWLLPWRAPISAGLNYRAPTATLYSGDGTGILEIL